MLYVLFCCVLPALFSSQSSSKVPLTSIGQCFISGLNVESFAQGVLLYAFEMCLVTTSTTTEALEKVGDTLWAEVFAGLLDECSASQGFWQD